MRQPALARRAGLTWPRLPAAAEVAITGAGYLGYALVRLAVRAAVTPRSCTRPSCGGAERRLHLDVEPSLTHLVAARHDPATIPEISRLLAARLLQPHPPRHATHWLNWRRRHQAAHAGTIGAHNSPETAESPWSASNWRLPSY